MMRIEAEVQRLAYYVMMVVVGVKALMDWLLLYLASLPAWVEMINFVAAAGMGYGAYRDLSEVGLSTQEQ